MSVYHLHPPRRRADARAAEHARWSALLSTARVAAAAVLRLPPSHPDVEDRAQDALVAFLASGLPRFDGARGTQAALLAAIARNCALGHLRARAIRVRAGARLRDERLPSGIDAEHRRVEAARNLGSVLSASARTTPTRSSGSISGASDRRGGAAARADLHGRERRGGQGPRLGAAGGEGARGGLTQYG